MARLRKAHPWLDHLFRANESFGNHYGNHYAAAITYFSILSLIPILMVAFAIAGIVLAGNTELLTELQQAITKSMPGALGDTVNKVVDQAIEARTTVGVVGLIVALYSGVGWMSNLRDALTAQWGQERGNLPLVKTTLSDLGSLIGLGLAIAVSFAITAAGTGLGQLMLRLVGLADTGWAETLLVVLTIVLSLAANWLVFLWVIARLPRERVGMRSAVRGALLAAVGFEVLKQLATVLLKSATHSPTGAVFGSVIGLLVFANLVARFLLLATAWTATARENAVPEVVAAPPPAMIRPLVRPREGLGPVGAAGLLAAGTLTGLALRRKR
ncbi:MAG TPA: inner membrane protein YhjD [Pseudonocardiaceae bacterium]|jgi:membrane protein|nr:inner membrane protein YhjD [Pseudonocardiaceae bacterium]